MDQSVCGAVVRCDGFIPAQFRQDAARKLLTELCVPLVKAEDVPDDDLDENLVLVHGDQAPECARC